MLSLLLSNAHTHTLANNVKKCGEKRAERKIKNEIEMNTEHKNKQAKARATILRRASSKNETNRPHSQHRPHSLTRSHIWSMLVQCIYYITTSINIQAECSHFLCVYFSLLLHTLFFIPFFQAMDSMCFIQSEWHPSLRFQCLQYITFYCCSCTSVFFLYSLFLLWVYCICVN